MAFLTKKEQAVVRAINSNKKLPVVKKQELINSINYTARMRQDGYRPRVREFIQALANHSTDQVIKALQ